MMINSFTPYISLADSPKIITPMNTKSDYSIPIGPLLNQKEFKLLSARNIKFKFEGAECVFKGVAGCTVIKSSNPLLPIGFTINAISTRTSHATASTVAFGVRCSWCSIAGDLIAITLFVALAPASSPATIVIATYSVGLGIILGNA